MKKYIIYIPGLGDHNDGGRRGALFFWRLQGVKTQLVPMKWYDGNTYDEKLDQVLQAADNALARGFAVVLVGESAGGSMALNALAARPDLRVITISGANDPSAKIAPTTLKKSPAFATSMKVLDTSLKTIDVARVDTVRGWNDRIVAARHTIIPRAHNHRVATIGHFMTIALCLTVFSFYVVTLAKR